MINEIEIRHTNYKKLLEEINRDKVNFPPADELVAWYKELVRDFKNSNEKWLKKLVTERAYENQGLNPPNYYPYDKW